jgi:hypothetical protein
MNPIIGFSASPKVGGRGRPGATEFPRRSSLVHPPFMSAPLDWADAIARCLHYAHECFLVCKE